MHCPPNLITEHQKGKLFLYGLLPWPHYSHRSHYWFISCPAYILPEPTKDYALLPAGRLNYFMPYWNILCTLPFMIESSPPHMSNMLYTRTPEIEVARQSQIGRKKSQILANGARLVFCSFACRFALDQAVDGFQQDRHFKRLGEITDSKPMHFIFNRICPISSD